MISRTSFCLVLLPHADDEAFVVTELKILYPYLEPKFVLLTRHQDQARRFSETQAALSFMNFSENCVADLGVARDGHLSEHLDETYKSLEKYIDANVAGVFDLICPAWEGGHQDHDATYLIAIKLKQLYTDRIRLRVFWLYSGLNTRWKFFRVAHSAGISCEAGRVSWRLGLKSLLLPFFYPSQIIAWLGLAPGYLRLRAIRRTLNISTPMESILLEPPSAAPLLYERYGRESWTNLRGRVENLWPELLKK
jgi:hypothetical protein